MSNKLIDEKGKLFGKINIIDLTILVVILAIFCAAAYMFTRRGGEAQEVATDGEVYVTVIARLVAQEVADQLEVGDKLVAKGAFTTTEIVSVDVEPGKWVSWTDEGEGIDTVHPLWKDVTVVVKDKGSPSNPIIRVGGQEARTGLTSFILKTQKVEVNATVFNVEFK